MLGSRQADPAGSTARVDAFPPACPLTYDAAQVPDWFRRLFPYSKWGAELNARITPAFFTWLVGVQRRHAGAASCPARCGWRLRHPAVPRLPCAGCRMRPPHSSPWARTSGRALMHPSHASWTHHAALPAPLAQVGPMHTAAAEVDGGVQQRSAVKIQRCRYLAESGCTAMCVNLCKVSCSGASLQQGRMARLPRTWGPSQVDLGACACEEHPSTRRLWEHGHSAERGQRQACRKCMAPGALCTSPLLLPQAPTQAFFTEQLGMPLTMTPNFEDYSCEVGWLLLPDDCSMHICFCICAVPSAPWHVLKLPPCSLPISSRGAPACPCPTCRWYLARGRRRSARTRWRRSPALQPAPQRQRAAGAATSWNDVWMRMCPLYHLLDSTRRTEPTHLHGLERMPISRPVESLLVFYFSAIQLTASMIGLHHWF